MSVGTAFEFLQVKVTGLIAFIKSKLSHETLVILVLSLSSEALAQLASEVNTFETTLLCLPKEKLLAATVKFVPMPIALTPSLACVLVPLPIKILSVPVVIGVAPGSCPEALPIQTLPPPVLIECPASFHTKTLL